MQSPQWQNDYQKVMIKCTGIDMYFVCSLGCGDASMVASTIKKIYPRIIQFAIIHQKITDNVNANDNAKANS